jgi:hypothetical protein
MKFRITRHAREEMQRRGIPEAMIKSVMDNPEQVVPEGRGLKAYHNLDLILEAGYT